MKISKSQCRRLRKFGFLSLLEALAKDSEFSVRMGTARTYIELGLIDKALPILEAYAQGEHFTAKLRAIEVLGTLGEKALPLLDSINSDNPDIRRALAEAYIELGQVDKALPILESLPDNGVLLAKAYIRSNQANKALPILEAAANDKPVAGNDRANAVRELGKLGKSALPTVETFLNDDSTPVRRAAAETCIELGEIDKALGVLKTLATKDTCIISDRWRAIEALGTVGEKALPTLEALVKSEDGSVRSSVVRTLAKMVGEKAFSTFERILPMLEVFQKDKNPFVRVGAAEVYIRLGQIDIASAILQDVVNYKGEHRSDVLDRVCEVIEKTGALSFLLDELVRDNKELVSYEAAKAYVALGQVDKALPLLDTLAHDCSSVSSLRRSRAAQELGRAYKLLEAQA